MYDLLSFIAGSSVKIYDDINDMPIYEKYKNNIFLLELLKGIHYILLTILAINNNYTFIFIYFLNVIHSLSNKIGYSEPYEHSVFYSFILIFLVIDYKKIMTDINTFYSDFTNDNKLNVFNNIFNNASIGIFIFLIIIFIGGYLENLICSEEYSIKKIFIRTGGLILFIYSYLFFNLNFLNNTFMYTIGYLFCSLISQINAIFYLKE